MRPVGPTEKQRNNRPPPGKIKIKMTGPGERGRIGSLLTPVGKRKSTRPHGKEGHCLIGKGRLDRTGRLTTSY